MNDLFDELLAICLDRLADGDSVADCTADFPDCPGLEPLLDTAAALLSLRDAQLGQAPRHRPRRHAAFRLNEYRLLWTA